MTDLTALAQGKLNDPILLKWALQRYREAPLSAPQRREAMERAWFETTRSSTPRGMACARSASPTAWMRRPSSRSVRRPRRSPRRRSRCSWTRRRSRSTRRPATYLPGFQLLRPVRRRATSPCAICCPIGAGWRAANSRGTARASTATRSCVACATSSRAWSFRSQFGYQNIMYITAGQVGGQGVGEDLGRLRARADLHAARHDGVLHDGARAGGEGRTSPRRTPR